MTMFGVRRMIDTDKYEGHTPAPWEIHGERICAQDACKIGNVGGEIATVIEEINTHLIADAPLLLEGIKRLREGIEKALIPTDSNPIIHPLVKLSDLRDALKELIE